MHTDPTRPEAPQEAEQEALLRAAREGDEESFRRLVAPHLPAIRRLLLRMLCHPEDAEDLSQETLLTAFRKLSSFRGEAQIGTWLYAIASRKALDSLRTRERWPRDAQTVGERVALASEEVMRGIDEVVDRGEFRYEYRQHVAYCFSCVARSLPPEESAALLLREMALLENRAAAKAMGLSEATFRHRLRAAREAMMAEFEGLCALVGKGGVCYQCAALRDYCAEDKRGPAPEPIAEEGAAPEEAFRRRLRVVREADLDQDDLHKHLFRFMSGLWDAPAEGAPEGRARR